MRIVVGVDGSPGARRALRWALDEAREHGADVVAVHAYRGVAASIDVPALASDGHDAAVRSLAAEVERVTADAAYPDPVERVVLDGDPYRVLAGAVRRSDLLVVGCPDHDGLAHRLAGTTRGYLVRHAPCPVVVVRPAALAGAPR